MAGARPSQLQARHQSILGEFQLLQILGSGGFGVAIKAINKSTNAEVAIKLIPEETNSSQWSSKSLQNEVKIISQISKHLNVVEYICCWKERLDADKLADIRSLVGKTKKLTLPANLTFFSVICIEMELCSCNLRTWLKCRQHGVIPRTSYKVFAQLVDGLEHIHKNGLIHRDLKPTNVFIYTGGTNPVVKIGDFGYAVLHSQSGSEYHTTNAGNKLYMAPEQEGKKYGQQADIYALGLILYELFDQNAQIKIQESLLFLKYNRKLPSDLERDYPVVSRLILEMIDYNPEDRPKFIEIRETIARAGKRASFSENEPNENLVLPEDEPLWVLIKSLEIPEAYESIGLVCTCCFQRLDFPRYKCCACKDVMLCQRCEEATGNSALTIIGHSDAHRMLKIKKSVGNPNTNAPQQQQLPGPSVADKNGCKHYRRKCQLHCLTCNEYYWCRLCHDEVRGRQHAFNRFKVGMIKCFMCSTPQPVGNKCCKCGTQFAKYFCSTCSMYDDSEDSTKLTWHCVDCGICRKKAAPDLEYEHCDNCGMCYPESHKCKPNAGKSTCSFCNGEIFDSSWPATLVSCGHYIHTRCLEGFRDSGAQCKAC